MLCVKGVTNIRPNEIVYPIPNPVTDRTAGMWLLRYCTHCEKSILLKLNISIKFFILCVFLFCHNAHVKQDCSNCSHAIKALASMLKCASDVV